MEDLIQELSQYITTVDQLQKAIKTIERIAKRENPKRVDLWAKESRRRALSILRHYRWALANELGASSRTYKNGSVVWGRVGWHIPQNASKRHPGVYARYYEEGRMFWVDGGFLRRGVEENNHLLEGDYRQTILDAVKKALK